MARKEYEYGKGVLTVIVSGAIIMQCGGYPQRTTNCEKPEQIRRRRYGRLDL
jgi:hypothetical protein